MAIRSKDINKELKIIDDMARVTEEDRKSGKIVLLKAMLKAMGLTVKLLRDYRNNQVLIMKKMGVELTIPEDVTEEVLK